MARDGKTSVVHNFSTRVSGTETGLPQLKMAASRQHNGGSQDLLSMAVTGKELGSAEISMVASRMPGQLTLPVSLEVEGNALEYDILAEKASALGRAGALSELTLARLREHEGDAETRRGLVRDAARAVYAYFIQRELCGFRRHDEIIREYGIPKEVLVRLGAV
jgi:Family of unknown function (DUF6665)